MNTCDIIHPLLNETILGDAQNALPLLLCCFLPLCNIKLIKHRGLFLYAQGQKEKVREMEQSVIEIKLRNKHLKKDIEIPGH